MTEGNTPSLHELQEKAKQLLRDTASYTGADIEAARGRLKRQLEAVRELKAQQGWLNAVCCGPVPRAVNQCVHQHAWTAIGVAALLGMMAGHCLTRRH